MKRFFQSKKLQMRFALVVAVWFISQIIFRA
jgi:hypothetical protein